MFCRLGFDDESRPVAAPVWLKLVCSRPVARIDQRRQRVHVRALELGELPVFEHLAHDLVLGRQFLQHVGRGGNRLALAVLHRRRQLQILEQNVAQLLRRADVERLARQRVDLAGEPRDLAFHQPREPLQLRRIDADAGPLHARQHAGQRQFDGGVQFAQAARIHRRRELLTDFERDIGMLLGRRAQLQIEAPARLLVQRAARGVGVQQKRVEHHVVVEAARLNSHAVQHQQRGFHVAGDLRHAPRLPATASSAPDFPP